MRTLCPEVTREQPPALSDKLNGRLDFLGQHKRKPEFPVVTRESRRNSRKTTCFPRHRNMRPLPARAPSRWRQPSPLQHCSPHLQENDESFQHKSTGAQVASALPSLLPKRHPPLPSPHSAGTGHTAVPPSLRAPSTFLNRFVSTPTAWFGGGTQCLPHHGIVPLSPP